MDFGVPAGSVLGYRRPIVVIQDDRLNRSASLTCVVAVVSSNVFLPAAVSGLVKDSVVNVSQSDTVDKTSLEGPDGQVAACLMSDANAGLRLVLAGGAPDADERAMSAPGWDAWAPAHRRTRPKEWLTLRGSPVTSMRRASYTRSWCFASRL